MAALGILWNIALFFGGLFFLAYYVSIRFMPELDLAASLTILIAASLTGGFVLLFITASFLLPSLLFGCIDFDALSKWSKGGFLSVIVIASVSIFYFFLVPLFLTPIMFQPEIFGVRIPSVIIKWFYIASFTVFNMSFVLVGWTRRRLVLSLILYIAVIMLFNILIPNAVMRNYKFGNFTASSLVLDQKGCDIAWAHELPGGGDPPCRFTDVMILSRLGSTYYVEASNDGKQLRFTIPADAVLSWAVSD